MEGVLDELRRRGRIADDGRPDRRTGEARQDGDAELLRGAYRGHHLLGRTLTDSLGTAVAPDVIGEQKAVTRLDRVANRMANTVSAQDRYAEFQTIEQRELGRTVIVLARRPLHFEMVAPAGEFQALITPLGDAQRQFLQGQVGPSTAEENDWPGHGEDSAIRSAAASR